MSLTDAVIGKAAPSTKPLKLVDAGGLYLFCPCSTVRRWRWDYRRPLTGQRNTLSFDRDSAEARGAAREPDGGGRDAQAEKRNDLEQATQGRRSPSDGWAFLRGTGAGHWVP